MELTSKQRAHLRSLANHLKPVAFVGVSGVSDAAVRTIEEAFNNRELLKVKVQENAPTNTKETASALTAAVAGSHVAQTIGRTIVLYRRHPDKPEIKLP